METSLKTGFAQVFSCCPKNLSCPNFGGAAAPLALPARTPMVRRTPTAGGFPCCFQSFSTTKLPICEGHLSTSPISWS